MHNLIGNLAVFTFQIWTAQCSLKVILQLFEKYVLGCPSLVRKLSKFGHQQIHIDLIIPYRWCVLEVYDLVSRGLWIKGLPVTKIYIF